MLPRRPCEDRVPRQVGIDARIEHDIGAGLREAIVAIHERHVLPAGGRADTERGHELALDAHHTRAGGRRPARKNGLVRCDTATPAMTRSTGACAIVFSKSAPAFFSPPHVNGKERRLFLPATVRRARRAP